MKYTLIGLALVLALSAEAQETLLLRQPALSAEHLAFVYAGDIWVADHNGRNPRRLTSSPVEEEQPKFSPDGSKIAFAAAHEGNVDIYVIDTEGGQPRRLTWHPGSDIPTGWTADGKFITMVSGREVEHGRSPQFYHLALTGGIPEKQMEARVFRAVYDGRDQRLAYMDHGAAYNGLFGGSSGWRGYGGGTVPEIRIMDLRRQSVTIIDGARATNFNPFWLDGKVYFLSDRNDKVFNLFRYDPANGQLEQITQEPLWDIRSAAGYGSSVVYEVGGRLKQLDLRNDRLTSLSIQINPDLPQLRHQWKDVSQSIQSADISPSGKRVIVTARGEVFTVPVDEGSARNLSSSGERREYTALWSPVGNEIAYITESESGQALVIKNQVGSGETRRYELGPHFYQLTQWSGSDDRHVIVYQDNHLGLHIIDPTNGEKTAIATGTFREQVEVSLSPDGRWLAYTQERPNYHRDLMLFNFESGEHTALTDGFADVASPAFSGDGQYLYFAASTNSGPTQVGLNMTSQERPYRAGLYVAVLAADGKSPLLPESGDEEAAEEDNEEGEDKEDGEQGEEKDAVMTTIDLPGLSERIVALPVAERNYSNLAVAEDGDLLYLQQVQPGISNEPPGDNPNVDNELMRFDFEEREANSILDAVSGFVLSAKRTHLLINKVGNGLLVTEVKGDELKPERLDLGGLRVFVDPRQEWAQIFDEAWRMEKEYFYAPNMHGLDWDAVYQRYRPLVDHVGRREDLNELMVEMIAEMQAGHNRVGGGDIYRDERVRTGLLGANFKINRDRYQLAKVYTAGSWNPFFKAPLATPGNEAREGEYIVAINGRDLTAADNIFALMQGLPEQQVTLRVGPNANGRDARDIVVEPVESEFLLRRWAWVENNRQLVDKATDGRVGYIYLPNTAGAGYTFFNRMFFSQVDKQALIIDERANGGGQAANYITEVLSRKHLSGWKDRDGSIFNTPAGALHGPKVMLIDQDAGSGGDYLPYSFRHLGIGQLIGTRTWGGLIGISTNPQLMDGGFLSVPFFRFFDPEGNWSIENEGVAPDIEVELDPIATNQGRDTQLEKAIEVVLAELEQYQQEVLSEAPPDPTELGK